MAQEHRDIEAEIERIKNLPEEEKRKLDERARNGETVVPGGTGGKSLEAQLHLAEGRPLNHLAVSRACNYLTEHVGKLCA